MSRVIAINGSPRREGNTGTLLAEALSGAAAGGADTELFHLYDMNYRGCVSCFACKRIGGRQGFCAMRDDASQLLEEIKGADAVIFGTPLYFMGVSSGLAAFFERLFFSNSIYSVEIPTVFPHQLKSAFIYTMNVGEELFQLHADKVRIYESFAERTLGVKPLSMSSFNTYQYSDYSKYEHGYFNERDKAEWRVKQFPLDREQARNIGSQLTED